MRQLLRCVCVFTRVLVVVNVLLYSGFIDEKRSVRNFADF